MTARELVDLIRKLRNTIERRDIEYIPPLTKDEAEFLLELIEKSWKG